MNFVRCAGAIALLGLVLAGCKEKRIAIEQDAGVICDEQERLIAGVCRFVCDRDGKCPEGERCNLFLGSCEPKPPVPDAGPLTTPCTTGADRCTADTKSIERCGTDNTWTVTQTCPVPNGFCKNEKCLSCQPGAAACLAADAGPSTQVSVCLDDGSGLRTITCAAAGQCTQGECRECTPGATRCSADSKSLQTCQKQPNETLTWKWTNTGDNLDATCITRVCELNAGGMPQCKPPACIPGATSCLNITTQQVCGSTGSFSPVSCTVTPDGGMDSSGECQNGVCVRECEQAVAAKSYFGCEYWSVNLDNSVDRLFKGNAATGQGTADSDFVFVATNQSVNDATVSVYRFVGAAPVLVKSVTVKGRNDPTKGLLKIPVPWQSVSPDSAEAGAGISGRARYGYRVTSTRPITLYQFNPIDAVKYTKACTGTGRDCSCNEYSNFGDSFSCAIGLGNPGSCVVPPGGGAKKCSYGSFSNDASLLLPAHILGSSHVVIAPGHSHISQGATQLPRTGQMVVLATQDNTQVTVKASAVTIAGAGIPSFAKGESRVFTLNSYEQLQLSSATSGADLECQSLGGGATWCRKDNDLTGTVVTSDKPVAMFAGHPCANVPFSRSYCDHVEEQLFPFATWGKSFVALPTFPLRLNNQMFSINPPPDHFKIVAACPVSQCPNGTLLTLSAPPAATAVLPANNCLAGTSLPANNCRLAGGSYIEFRSLVPFTLTADQPVAIAQFMPGQGNVTGLPTDPEQGDPSMILLPPIEQWRSKYTVLASTGLKDNYLGLSIDSTKVQSVSVDGVLVTGFQNVNGTPFQVKNHPVGTGTHSIVVTPKTGVTTTAGTGVTIYGYDAQVSYGYTGGLDLQAIVSGINPGG